MASRRERTLAALTLLAVLSVGGCSTPPWEQGASASPAASVSPAASATPPASPSPTAEPVENDLAKGSLKRTLSAGAAELKVSTAPLESTRPLLDARADPGSRVWSSRS
jgi:hypothetical protein